MTKIKLENLHVVYFSSLYSEVFVCANAFKAKQLVKAYERLNRLTNRNFVKIITGPCSEVFTYKIPEFINTILIGSLTEKDRKSIFDYITDIPTKAR